MANACTVTLDTVCTHSEDMQRRMSGTIAASTSYSTGGDTVTAGQFALAQIDDIFIAPTTGWIFSYNSTTGKVLVYGQTAAGSTTTPAALAEASSGTNLSAVAARFSAFGV